MDEKGTVSDIYLIADMRERAVIPFLPDALGQFQFIQKQITVGDYNICQTVDGEAKILACIERKTYADFAASFGDGRYGNYKKMKDLRDQTHCQLYYFIEGPAFPGPNRKFNRIRYSNISSAITKLMVRDGISIVQTKDEMHTAARIYDFLDTFDSETPYVSQISESVATPVIGGGAIGELGVPDILTTRVERTDIECAVVMWSKLTGVSVPMAKVLTSHFTVSQLVRNEITPEYIATIKTSSGRMINKKARTSLIALINGSDTHMAKLISGMRNMSLKISTEIVTAAGSATQLCAMSVEELACIMLQQKNRTVKLGATRASRILDMVKCMETAINVADEPETNTVLDTTE